MTRPTDREILAMLRTVQGVIDMTDPEHENYADSGADTVQALLEDCRGLPDLIARLEAPQPLTLANCDGHEGLKRVARLLSPARDRRELIFAAGCLGNQVMQKDLGSIELATLYDGGVAAGLLPWNSYWPDYAKGKPR